jgi:hypothetical protein
MKTRKHPRRLHACAVALCALSPIAIATARADTNDDWQFRASAYAFLPEISGQMRAPVPGGGDVDVDADDLLDNLKFAAMGSFEAQKGRWGLFTDLIYMNVGDSISNSSALGHGTVPLPPQVSADATLDVKATVFTLAANYRAYASNTDTFDVFGGARMLDAEGDLQWQFNSPAGPVPPPQGSGRIKESRNGWDGIVGIKGRHRFDANSRWFVPYYVDAGTGESDLTWQAMAGIGYAADWGDVSLVWRHLDYDFGEGRMIDNLQFSGPALGVAFNW